MTIRIKDLPNTERPYEKFELYGEKSLSNAELLAIIIKSGTKGETSVEIAQKILKLGENEDISFIKDLSIKDLMKVKGIGKVKAIQIKACAELAIRMSRPTDYRKVKIKGPGDVAKMLYGELSHMKREIVKVLLLDNGNNILKILDISVGGSNFVNVDIKEIVRSALGVGAIKLILVHNHPTGNSKPSEADIKFTDKLYMALSYFDIDLLDHVVIGNMEYTSVYSYVQKLEDKDV